jgi:hypothetical protein
MSRGADWAPSRRQFLVSAGSALAGTALFSVRIPAAESLPPLAANDPAALALHYTDEANRIDSAKDPTHVAGAACGNCKLYQGGDAASGPCQLYPGKSVSSNGWCMGYQKKG